MSVGKRLPRKDARAKVEGKAVFIDDMNFSSDTWHLAVKRSSIPNGKILEIKIDHDRINDLGAIVATAKDIPGKNVIHIVFDDWHLLANPVVRYIGDPVAIIVAPSKNTANEALKAIEINYEEWSHVEDPLAARNHPDIRIFGDNNIFSEVKVGKGDIEKGFAAADVVIEGEYQTPAQEHAYIEPQGFVCVPEPDGGMTAYGSQQCPYYVHGALADVLGLPWNMIRVIQTTTGGAFGGKEDVPSQVAALCALGAHVAKRPVKLIYSREEDIETTSKRHPGYIKYRLGAKRDGTLTAIEVEYVMDSGAYATLGPAVVWRGALHSAGPYRCDNVKVDSFCVATNKVPNGAFRGFGSPQVLFACESQMEKLASELNMNPVELRRKNLLVKGDWTPFNQELKFSVGSIECLEKAVESSGWKDKWQPAPDLTETLKNKHPRTRRGMGVSTIYYGVGLGAGGKHMARTGAYVQIHHDGTAIFSVGTTEMGQGMITVLSQVVADSLGLPYDNVRMNPVDTSRVPNSGPTVASRATTMSGRALNNACSKIVNNLKVVAAGMLGQESSDIELVGNFFISKSDDQRRTNVLNVIEEAHVQGVSCIAAGYDRAPPTDWDAEKGQGNAYAVYSWCTNVAEVDVDLDTGEVTLLKLTAVHDVGKAINPQTVEGQIEGGSLQGAAYGRFEEIVFGEDGSVMSNNLGTYIIPTTLDAPEIKAIIVEEEYPEGPFGGKGLGEQPLMGVAPAVTNAIHNATGVWIDEIPATPERVWKALNRK
ncbi:MAG: xanthine dehydrogenase family protein molybdopterin-binding subunit [Candidatus Hodarchaeales archaeon]|jgi:CO/xanthine dehydrogenase Mo-binding subunit